MVSKAQLGGYHYITLSDWSNPIYILLEKRSESRQARVTPGYTSFKNSGFSNNGDMIGPNTLRTTPDWLAKSTSFLVFIPSG